MDFFQSQDQARRTTGRLVLYFVLAVVLINLAIYAAAIALSSAGQATLRPTDWWQPSVLVLVAVVTCTIIFLGSLYKTIQVGRGGGAAVASMLGGRRILPNTTNLSEKRLLNVVEEMALAAGIPVPPVYVLENERSINAFAAGFTVGDAVIGVNRGTLEYLSRDELQGVIGHEFSHILNGDMRLNLRLIGLLGGILLLATIGFYVMRFGGGGRSSSSKEKGGGYVVLMGLAVYVIGYVGLFFARLIKAAVSRQREYLADASAVQFTRNPDGLSGALKKIGGLAIHSLMDNPEAETASHMFFGSFRESWFPAFATHPPLVERIRRIDPEFDGKYPQVSEQGREAVREGTAPRRAKSPFEATKKLLRPLGGDRFPLDPAVLLATIGAPTTNHVAAAQQFLDGLPGAVDDAARDPFSARLVILAILLDENEAIRQQQLAAIHKQLGEPAAAETVRLAPQISEQGNAVRLPLIEIAHSTLRQLSPDQYRRYRALVEELIHSDKRVNYVEFIVLHTLLSRLDRHFGQMTAPPVRYPARHGVLPEVSDVVSTLVFLGHSDEKSAQTAFRLASQAYSDKHQLSLRPRAECSLSRLSSALQKLAAGSPAVKKRVIHAATVAVASDGYVTAEEAELLRTVADAIDCPVPPLFAGSLPGSKDRAENNVRVSPH